LRWPYGKEVEVIPALRASIENKQTAPACPKPWAAKHHCANAHGLMGQHMAIYICNLIWMGKAHENKLIILKL
jgi:hypothetical protein